ncbi:hypothetical protein [Streptomyces paludis]|uniref:Uncharacterized protein n=1 Tax=Streptomyces paludis TaxID=2282738 RepID=A0A345HZT9_9ACTN|nr:hypothetical protein [Streptomyces paludis]AXG82213.1 hypothetical protein DVK44_36025 [Streptomyces paludis]
MLTINVTLLLVVIVVLRLRRRTEARSRLDEKCTVVIVLALGVLLAPTPVGQGIPAFAGRLIESLSQSSFEPCRSPGSGPRRGGGRL